MNKKPKIAFCPADKSNDKFFQQLQNSLRKFHTEEELPLIRYDNPNPVDRDFWYKATPLIASELLKEYETVIKLDADQIITSDISHIWEGNFDIACVLNSNPREFQNFPYQCLNIDPLKYFNNGLVVMKNPDFVSHWLSLCNSPIFSAFQMREQDLLNILCLQNYEVRNLDNEDKFHGLISKGYWPQIELRGNLLFLPKNEEWPIDSDKQICVIHFAGGSNDPDKGNLKIRFKPEVVKFIEELII